MSKIAGRDLISELKAVMAYEYKRIDITTLTGLKQAERLKANGWKVISSSIFSIVFERSK